MDLEYFHGQLSREEAEKRLFQVRGGLCGCGMVMWLKVVGGMVLVREMVASGAGAKRVFVGGGPID